MEASHHSPCRRTCRTLAELTVPVLVMSWRRLLFPITVITTPVSQLLRLRTMPVSVTLFPCADALKVRGKADRGQTDNLLPRHQEKGAEDSS